MQLYHSVCCVTSVGPIFAGCRFDPPRDVWSQKGRHQVADRKEVQGLRGQNRRIWCEAQIWWWQELWLRLHLR